MNIDRGNKIALILAIVSVIVSLIAVIIQIVDNARTQ